MCTVDGYDPVFTYQRCDYCNCRNCCFREINAKKNKIFDEFGRENLKTLYLFENCFCFNDYCNTGLRIRRFFRIIAGYFVVGGILALAIIRAIIFTIIDKKGM
ncbi:MAG: hypothetical protein V8R51_08985 [Clostridia bacterium]